MSFFAQIVLVLATLGGAMPAHLTVDAQQTPQVCEVSENEAEFFAENQQFVLLEVITIQGTTSIYDSSQRAADDYTLFANLRRGHEIVGETLTDCAVPLNAAYIRTISAMQDVLAAKLMQSANPGNLADSRVRSSLNHLSEAFSDLSDLSQTIRLTAN